MVNAVLQLHCLLSVIGIFSYMHIICNVFVIFQVDYDPELHVNIE